MILSLPFTLRVAGVFLSAAASAAAASTIYSNDFETNSTTGFTASGSLSSLGFTTLPTDSGGPASTNTSTWLGRIGEGVAKNSGGGEIVSLNLTGLTAGQSYSVGFDLLIGASWDGSASGYGTDEWYFAVDGTRLVDATFSNVIAGDNGGAYSPQTYSDTQYTDPNGAAVAPLTGSEASYIVHGTSYYAPDYSIYSFGHGAGNPNLSFVATGSDAVLEFGRPQTASGDSADEYWALDNVTVTGAGGAQGVPDAGGTLAMVGGSAIGILAFARRFII